MKKRKEETKINGKNKRGKKNANKTLKKKPPKDEPYKLTPEEEAMKLRYDISP